MQNQVSLTMPSHDPASPHTPKYFDAANSNVYKFNSMRTPLLTVLSILGAFALTVAAHSSRADDYIMMEKGTELESIDVDPTDLVTLVGGTSYPNAALFGVSANTGRARRLAWCAQSEGNGDQYTTAVGSTWTGLTRVYLHVWEDSASWGVTLRITKQGASFLSNPVVLPPSSGGPYEISVETSADLDNWSPAAPGIIPAGSPLGYWRIVVNQIVEGEASMLAAHALAATPYSARAVEYVSLEGTEGYNTISVDSTDLVTLMTGTRASLYGTSAKTGAELGLAFCQQTSPRDSSYAAPLKSRWKPARTRLIGFPPRPALSQPIALLAFGG